MKKKIIIWGRFISVLVFALIARGCEKEVYVEPKSDSVNTYTRVYIESSPEGATIYLNGKTTGRVTPDTVKWLTEGDYQVTLKKQYFWDTTFTASAINSKITACYIDYYQSERMLGQISCTSNPAGAKIYLDNVYTGKTTPYVLTKLMPQVHRIMYECPEYRKDSVDVIVKSSSIVPCGLALEDTLDVITYNMTNSGLPSNDFTSLAEDKEGNMWFGTSTEGLLKYDGKKFYRFTAENTVAMPSNYVRKIVKDKENNLWIGFSNGIAKYDGHIWNIFQNNMVASLNVCADNTIIAASVRGGIFKYSSGNVERITASANGLSDNELSSAYLDKSGFLWVGLAGGGLDRFDGTEWKHFNSASGGIPSKYNSALVCDADGILFGLFHEDYSSVTSLAPYVFSKYSDGKWNNIYSAESVFSFDNIYIDNKNTAWFSMNGKIFRVSDKSSVYSITRLIHQGIRRFAGSSLIITTYGTEVFVDSQENLWIIGNAKGLVKIKKGRWNY
jgi:sugar lactone lactonase YvrE